MGRTHIVERTQIRSKVATVSITQHYKKYAVAAPIHVPPLSLAGCPVNFEFANYTIITSKCKGPKYPADLCCSALKEFACPYAEDINDGSNDCASTMFSYINLYGKYPPGLFASECREGKNGLECPANAPQSADDSSTGHVTRSFFPLVTLVSGFLLGFLFS